MRAEFPERGAARLDRGTWAALEGSPDFWRLEARGIVSVRRRGPGLYELVGGGWVGRAICDGVELVATEKISGSLRSLAAVATGRDVRVPKVSSSRTEFDEVTRFLVDELVAEASDYVAFRRPPRYSYESALGPVLSGALDVGATLRLWAAGEQSQFAFKQGRVVRDTPLDRAVLAALIEVEVLAPVLRLESKTLRAARNVAAGLEEVRDEAFVLSGTIDHLEALDVVEGSEETLPADRDLSRLAQVILSGHGFAGHRLEPGLRVARSLFMDLAPLWERAVRRALTLALPNHRVNRGQQFDRVIFSGGEDPGLASPDLVLEHRSTGTVVVGDAKWKQVSAPEHGGPIDDGSSKVSAPLRYSRADLYQVLIHAEALGSRCAFLVFPVSDPWADGPAATYLGRTAVGCHCWVTAARPAALVEDIDSIVHLLGLRERAAAEPPS